MGGTFGSPTKTGKSPLKLTAKARKNMKKGEDEANPTADKKESGLSSPTSISM